MAAITTIESSIPHEPAFEPAEFRARLERVRERMAIRGVDVLLLFSPANVFYLSGLDNDNFWEPLALVVTQTADPVLCLPAFERGTRREHGVGVRRSRRGSATRRPST